MIVPANNTALAENALETTHSQYHLNPDYVRYEERMYMLFTLNLSQVKDIYMLLEHFM